MMSSMPADVSDVARQLAEVGRRFEARGWVLGTSGNFSALSSREPLRLAITASGLFKGELTPDQILEIDDRAAVVGISGARPSAEAQLHVEIVKSRQAGAVLHTHSIWSTTLSDRYGDEGGLTVSGYEMLKGLDGVATHEHREWIPILENDQDMTRLAAVARSVLAAHPECHAFLLRRHGLYTWGRTLPDAVRHVEILEFLLEAIGRRDESAIRVRDERSAIGGPAGPSPASK
jgi:methylthioribulose-1-phosphate dehydratase